MSLNRRKKKTQFFHNFRIKNNDWINISLDWTLHIMYLNFFHLHVYLTLGIVLTLSLIYLTRWYSVVQIKLKYFFAFSSLVLCFMVQDLTFKLRVNKLSLGDFLLFCFFYNILYSNHILYLMHIQNHYSNIHYLKKS